MINDLFCKTKFQKICCKSPIFKSLYSKIRRNLKIMNPTINLLRIIKRLFYIIVFTFVIKYISFFFIYPYSHFISFSFYLLFYKIQCISEENIYIDKHVPNNNSRRKRKRWNLHRQNGIQYSQNTRCHSKVALCNNTSEGIINVV